MGEKRMLLVDDNPSDRKIIKLVAEKSGFLVSEAADGFQALEALTDQTFTLFVVDLQMPRMTGLQLVRRLRGLPEFKKTPILISSARNRPIDVQTAVQNGATDYVVKPMDIQVLEEKINRLSAGAAPDWKMYDLPENLRFAQAGVFVHALAINEIGAWVSTPLVLPAGFSFSISLDLLAAKGLPQVLAKIEKSEKTQEGFRYLVQFIGLTEADRKKIRLSCREIWTKEEEKS